MLHRMLGCCFSVQGRGCSDNSWDVFAEGRVGYSHHPRAVKHVMYPNMTFSKHGRIFRDRYFKIEL